MQHITQATLRSLSAGDICSFEFGISGERRPYIEVSCLRVTDISATKIYVEILADRIGNERRLNENEVELFRPHAMEAVERLRSLYGPLPMTFLIENSDGSSGACDAWLDD